jgi:hypothetical protein
LTQGHRKAELKKRYRNDLASSRTRCVGEAFIALWQNVVEILRGIAAEYDDKWRVRRRLIDSMLLMLVIFRLVSSKSSQSYGTTIDELWDSCDRLELSLPQKSSIAPSSFCVARKKLHESIFQCANTRILQAYAPESKGYTWHDHRLFAVDGTKINLPRQLLDDGYQRPNKKAHYPLGLVSCLYELRSRLPLDFDLVAHSNERKCARNHLAVLNPNDVVVYDQGYFSYPMLHQHQQTGIHAVFRLQQSSYSVIDEFFASDETDRLVTIFPSSTTRSRIRRQHAELDIVPLPMRLLKYEISGKTYCLGTTLVEPQQHYALHDFMQVYHSRWGIEELYKVSKRLFIIEDFHAKSERGVKQELFAHFVLITMNRLFANHADHQLNAEPPSSVSLDQPGPHPPGAPTRIKTNFKSCIHVIHRHLEELLLLGTRMKSIVQKVFDFVVHRHQKERPGRAYPRKSRKPDPRWQPSKKKKKRSEKKAGPPSNCLRLLSLTVTNMSDAKANTPVT